MRETKISVPFSAAKVIRYFAATVLIVGGFYSLWSALQSPKLVVDTKEAEALALVQQHSALGSPTILEAMNEHVQSMKERGRGVRLGEWQVKQVEGNIYEIRVQLRDQGVRGQWFEREFIWHAHLDLKKVNAASLPADGVTPKPSDNGPASPPAEDSTSH